MNTIKPMKAHRYNERKIPANGYIQPKLNGLRAIWNGESFNSYNLEVWKPNILNHITKVLVELGLDHDNVDGEMYRHGESLQWINSRASVIRTSPHPQEDLVQFHIFDVACNLTFELRLVKLDLIKEAVKNWESDNGVPCPVQVCPTYYYSNSVTINQLFKLFRKEGYEGMIYRERHATYGFLHYCGNKENRWWHIIKRKYWEDMDAIILDCNEGEGKFSGSLGSFTMKGENGSVFNVGSGEALTDASRQRFWENIPNGTRGKVKYEMLSDSGIPLKPTLEAVYE